MAITIQHAPGTYMSVHGDIIFTVCDIVKASDPATYPDYRYICDIYVDGVFKLRLKSYPNPTNKCGVFNVANVLRNYIAATFNPTANTIQAQEMGASEFRINATMKFGEEYEIAGVMTLTTNVTVDSERTYYNHYDARLLGVDSNLIGKIDMPVTERATYANTATITRTSIGFPIYKSTTNHYVPYVPSTSSAFTLKVRAYTDAGSLCGSQDISVNPAASKTVQVLNLSPAALNTSYPGLIPLTVASYYTVEFSNSVIVLDRVLKFNLVCESQYQVYTIHFLNRYGGWESRDFTKVSRKMIAINKEEYGRLPFTMDSSGVVSYKNANNVYNETRSVYSKQFTEKMVLNTDTLTDNEYTWLADLFLSPQVYIELVDESNNIYFVPCCITDTDYEYRKRVNDKLTNITMKIEFGNQFNSQYR